MFAEDSESLLILGTGAMACLFAARLSSIGADVIMLGAWEQGLEAIHKVGVRLLEPGGRERAYPARATNDTRECAGVRFALVLVKSWQTGHAARQLLECLSLDGMALSLQNGLGNREILAQALGPERVALGVTTAGATLLEPGRVRQAGKGTITINPTPELAPLASWLSKAGFQVDHAHDTAGLLWGKLVINAAINPLTALLGVPNGELLNREPARALMAAVALETADVARALGITLPYPDPVAQVEAVARDTAQNRSSMLQDIGRGAPTEIDAICGAIVHAGKQCNLPTPINYTLLQLIKAHHTERQ